MMHKNETLKAGDIVCVHGVYNLWFFSEKDSVRVAGEDLMLLIDIINDANTCFVFLHPTYNIIHITGDGILLQRLLHKVL